MFDRVRDAICNRTRWGIKEIWILENSARSKKYKDGDLVMMDADTKAEQKAIAE
jgi:hypothetical protein